MLQGWPVPYTMKPKDEVERKHLEEVGILHKAKFSSWSTPSVPVVEPNGAVLICGYYKITVNAQMQTEKYLLPCIDDIFAKMARGDEVH